MSGSGRIRLARPWSQAIRSRNFGAEVPENENVFHGRPNPSDVSVDWVTKIGVKKNQQRAKRKISTKSENYNSLVDGVAFKVPRHWFWDEFSDD